MRGSALSPFLKGSTTLSVDHSLCPYIDRLGTTFQPFSKFGWNTATVFLTTLEILIGGVGAQDTTKFSHSRSWPTLIPPTCRLPSDKWLGPMLEDSSHSQPTSFTGSVHHRKAHHGPSCAIPRFSFDYPGGWDFLPLVEHTLSFVVHAATGKIVPGWFPLNFADCARSSPVSIVLLLVQPLVIGSPFSPLTQATNSCDENISDAYRRR